MKNILKRGILLFPLLFASTFAVDPLLVEAVVHWDNNAPLQPIELVEERMSECKGEFEKRWALFSSGKTFSRWHAGKKDEEILAEFIQVAQNRVLEWYETLGNLKSVRPAYALAEELLVNDHVRTPSCLAFQYNQCCSYYNASYISISGLRFLAAEGPREKDTKGFFNLLLNARVSRLVRLTPAHDTQGQKCYPYWEKRVVQEGDNALLEIPREDEEVAPLRYFVEENWIDRQGISPEKLLALVNDVRSNCDPSKELIGVHCSSGVGRTGTFIAAFTLLEKWDRERALGKKPDEIQVSIEEVVSQLSLQRFFMVSSPSQYVTLHRLLDLYAEQP